MNRRILFWAIALLTLGAFVLLESGLSHSFQDCVHKAAQQYTGGRSHPGDQFIGVAVEAKAMCTFRFIDAHNGVFALVAAFAVAWFTFTLWQSTEKLWIEGRESRRVTNKMLKLSRKEFRATHRPWIAIRKIKPIAPAEFKGGGLTIKVEFTIENTGSAPATDLLLMHDSHQQYMMPPIKGIMEKLLTSYRAHKSNVHIVDALPSYVVMPGEVITLPVEFVLDMGEMLRAPANPNLAFFAPIVVGGFFYRSPLHKSDRCMGFTYAASLKNNWVEVDADGSGAPAAVSIRKWQTGWTAT